ncbi:site-specific DNA-methyltransferase [Bacillus cereus group sp. BfR-BA-01425]|uniref:DNA-methyltransferase n=1 Tax=Bacillus cereus group sp. BfR-BA-01425 TaxID=2920342 RepID=UPI001F55B039|nr:site-specific DNA-methyltransferase [Bacillus cereus group sp. BfR-BA-01425]
MINQIHNMDCLEGMELLQDKSVDMILCDLPYGVTQNKWDVVIPFDELWKQYERVIKDNGAIVLTAAQPFSAQLIVSNPKLFRYEWIWEKTAATGHLNAKKMPMRAHESILVFYKKLPTYNPIKTTGHAPVNSYTKHQDDGTNYGKTKIGISGGGSTDRYPRSVQRFSTDKQKEAIHPTQKPVALFEYLIKTYTNEGETVLDNCIGSGTTAVAAINTNRNFIGFEISKEYCAAANQRIDNLQQVLQVI